MVKCMHLKCTLARDFPGGPEVKNLPSNSWDASISASLTVLKPLTVWITTNCEKFLQRWEYQATRPPS